MTASEGVRWARSGGETAGFPSRLFFVCVKRDIVSCFLVSYPNTVSPSFSILFLNLLHWGAAPASLDVAAPACCPGCTSFHRHNAVTHASNSLWAHLCLYSSRLFFPLYALGSRQFSSCVNCRLVATITQRPSFGCFVFPRSRHVTSQPVSTLPFLARYFSSNLSLS